MHEDVVAHRKVLQSAGLDESEYAIIVRDLCKKYPNRGPARDDHHNREYAVDHLWLGVKRGECFGLLGSNGAGKTTTINILTGLLSATSGSATVAGYDIATSKEEVHKTIGVCLQFDTLWPMLTAEEHLLFFTRLKGSVAEYRHQILSPKSPLTHVHI
jgi:ABC-type multidrug transport system ATPase subunit